MTAWPDTVGHLPGAAAYAVLAGAVLTESVLLLGAFVPTLTLLLGAGALARAGQLSLPLVIAAAAGAVPAGDFLAHRTGRLLADRLRAGRVGRRVPAAAWRRAEHLMAARGGQAVFLARFVPVIRTLMPHLAGASHLPYRRIAPYSALAAPLWATAEAGTGYLAAPVLRRVVTLGGPLLAVVAVTGMGIAVARLTARRPRAVGEPPNPDHRLPTVHRPIRLLPSPDGTPRCSAPGLPYASSRPSRRRVHRGRSRC
ncbi:DedA family protein [Streptomyces sp. NPDC039016]|uniref:DedA family protein n=1 Tax=Streptomyces sp. NPDC039016 TaxID=3154330 RepID=UPI000C27CB15|nr:VTT domain-containing protein [Streptomyces sp. CB02959]PJN35645.1 hypothetical protein CG747_37880 [Streptomyces sp. CB02959]